MTDPTPQDKPNTHGKCLGCPNMEVKLYPPCLLHWVPWRCLGPAVHRDPPDGRRER